MPSARYATIETAPATGPSIIPASTTSIGCSVSGTGVPGSGIAICDAAATAITKPAAPNSATRLSCANEIENVAMSVVPGNTEGDGIAATKTQRRQPRARAAFLHGVQQRREDAGATRADGV